MGLFGRIFRGVAKSKVRTGGPLRPPLNPDYVSPLVSSKPIRSKLSSTVADPGLRATSASVPGQATLFETRRPVRPPLAPPIAADPRVRNIKASASPAAGKSGMTWGEAFNKGRAKSGEAFQGFKGPVGPSTAYSAGQAYGKFMALPRKTRYGIGAGAGVGMGAAAYGVRRRRRQNMGYPPPNYY